MKKYTCKICGKRICYTNALYGSGLCRSCASKTINHNKKSCNCCVCKSQRGELSGENHSNYTHGLSSKPSYCKDCGVEVTDYRVERCKDCNNKQHSLEMTGENNPAWTGGPGHCQDCGEELVAYTASRCKNCNSKYLKILFKGRIVTWGDKISKTMLKEGTSRGKNNPWFGKIPPHGKGDYYKNIWMRSSYEILFAKFLDFHNIEWKYEPKTFNLVNTSYRPDFYLPKTDEYIEIKGYWRDDAKYKFELTKIFYPEIKIQVLMQKDLQELEVLK